MGRRQEPGRPIAYVDSFLTKIVRLRRIFTHVSLVARRSTPSFSLKLGRASFVLHVRLNGYANMLRFSYA